MSQAILALVTAIIGGFIGAFLNSHTDRQGRLFDKRSVVFGDFMVKLNEAIKILTNLVNDNQGVISHLDWDDAVWTAIHPAYNAERVARLFLKQKERDAFTKAFLLTLQQIDNYKSNQPLTSLYPDEYINEIEEIFLSNLEPEPFYASYSQKLKVWIKKCKTKIRSDK